MNVFLSSHSPRSNLWGNKLPQESVVVPNLEELLSNERAYKSAGVKVYDAFWDTWQLNIVNGLFVGGWLPNTS